MPVEAMGRKQRQGIKKRRTASGLRIWHYTVTASIYELSDEPWRNLILSAGIQGKCWDLLP